jgi:TonB family protein
LTRPDRWRVTAARAASLLAHVAVLGLVRAPAPPPPPEGSRLNLLLVPVPGERRAESVPEVSASAAVPPSEKGAKAAARERKAQAAASATPEILGRKRPSVSAGPVTAPATPPGSQVAGADTFLGPDAVSVPPTFAAPFEMPFPRGALAQGRRGVVVVQVLIDEDGRVAEALALPGADADFTAAALAGLRAARFRPAQAGGGPVKARAYFAVSFVIE